MIGRQRTCVVLALSSGSLVTDVLPEVVAQTRALVRALGVSVLLSPGGDHETAAGIVVTRQLSRGFGLERGVEDRKFRARLPEYLRLADLRVDSAQPPDRVARDIAAALAARNG